MLAYYYETFSLIPSCIRDQNKFLKKYHDASNKL